MKWVQHIANPVAALSVILSVSGCATADAKQAAAPVQQRTASSDGGIGMVESDMVARCGEMQGGMGQGDVNFSGATRFAKSNQISGLAECHQPSGLPSGIVAATRCLN